MRKNSPTKTKYWRKNSPTKPHVFPANLSGSEHEGGEGESSRWKNKISISPSFPRNFPISAFPENEISHFCYSYVLVVSLCLNLPPFVVCLPQTLPELFCANLLLRAFEGERVLNGLACKYTKSHLDYMLHALGENLYILTSTTSTNTEIPTWTTYSEWEFVCFNKYRNTLICKCQIMKYLVIEIL